MTVSTLHVRMTADASAVGHMAGQVSRHMERMRKDYARTAGELQSVAQGAMLRITAPIALLGGLAIRTASQIEEQMSHFRAVFAQHAQDVEQWAQTQADAMNRSRYDLKSYAATYQDTFVPLGFARDEAAELSKVLTTLAVDLASFVNMAEPEAVNSLTSAIVGNHEAVRRFGIVITQTALNTELLRMGIAGGTAAASEQQKVLARMRIILGSTRDAQGDAIRTQESFANQQRAAAGHTREAAKAIGDLLLPAAGKVLGAIGSLAKRFTALSEGQKRWLIIAAAVAAALPVLLFAYTGYLKVLGWLAPSIALVTTAKKALVKWTGSTTSAFAALRAKTMSLSGALNAVGLTAARLKLLAFGGLVAAALWLALNWDRASRVFTAIWHGLSAAILYGASLIVRGVGSVVSALAWLVPGLRPAAQAVASYADGLKRAANTSAQFARAATLTAKVGPTTQAAADAATAAADAQSNLADATEDAAAAAAQNLQSFDEVHTIQEDMAKAGAGAMAGLDLTGLAYPMPEPPEVEGMTSVFDQIGEVVSQLRTRWTEAVSAIGQQWDRLKQWAFETFPELRTAMDLANSGIQWIRDNWPAIGPIVETIAGIIALLLVPALIKTGVEALIAAGKFVLAWAWKGLAAAVNGAIIIGKLVLIGITWAASGAVAIYNAGKHVKAWAMQSWAAMAGAASAAWAAAAVVAKWVWMALVATAKAVGMAAAWLIALGPVGWVIALVALVAGIVIYYWDEIKAWTIQTWTAVAGWLSQTWESLKTWVNQAWASIAGTVSRWWSNLRTGTIDIWMSLTGWLRERWAAIRDTASDVFGALREQLTSIWNRIVDTVRSAVDRILGPINDVIDTVRRALDWLGRLTGASAPTVPPAARTPAPPTPRLQGIPAFQDGGVLLGHRPTLALLHPPEAVIPLGGAGRGHGGGVETIADAIGQAVYAAMRDGSRVDRARGGAGADRELVLQIDGHRIARVLVPALQREEQRTGSQILRLQEV